VLSLRFVEIPADERTRLQTEWKAKQVARPSDQARTGDYVKLLVQWYDVSGIPVVAYPPGTVLKVLVPDLTSRYCSVWTRFAT